MAKSKAPKGQIHSATTNKLLVAPPAGVQYVNIPKVVTQTEGQSSLAQMLYCCGTFPSCELIGQPGSHYIRNWKKRKRKMKRAIAWHLLVFCLCRRKITLTHSFAQPFPRTLFIKPSPLLRSSAPINNWWLTQSRARTHTYTRAHTYMRTQQEAQSRQIWPQKHYEEKKILLKK